MLGICKLVDFSQVTNIKENTEEKSVMYSAVIVIVHAGGKTLTSPLLPIALIKVLDITHPCVDHSHLTAEKRHIIRP